MQILNVIIYSLMIFIYLVGAIFTVMLERGVREEKKISGIAHVAIMLLIWIASPVLVVLLFKEVFHKR